MGRPRKYFTEEERKAAERERSKRYRELNPEYKEKHAEYMAKWRKNSNKYKNWYKEYQTKYQASHKTERNTYLSEKRKTPKGRAKMLIDSYRREDKKYNRGECTLTADWIVENIFSQPCHYCGKTDWHELGCDRIDNSLPHTPDNVVPCCKHCNDKRGVMGYYEFIKRINKDLIDLI